MEEELSRRLLKDWIRRRVDSVQSKYSAYDALSEIGVEGIVDEETPISLFCPFHPNVNTPAARYYPPSGRNVGYLRCFACKENWRSISLFAKSRGKRFMDALQELERRFRISVPKRPEAPEYVDPVERTSSYESGGWMDVPRVLSLLEGKLLRIRDVCPMSDYVKFCRVMDAVLYDFEKSGKADPSMSSVLKKIMSMMDDIRYLADIRDGDGDLVDSAQ